MIGKKQAKETTERKNNLELIIPQRYKIEELEKMLNDNQRASKTNR